MKYCKDCIYIDKNYRFKDEAKCTHSESIVYVDVIDASVTYELCYVARSYSGKCGIGAKLFSMYIV